MYTYDRFIKSKWSLAVIADRRIVFRSQASAIRPLIRYLREKPDTLEPVTIYDKYVGRAAALLMVLVKPAKVYTPVISEGGAQTLEAHKIPFKADRQVKYLMGLASDEMCRWEKMTIGKTPDEFWAMLADR